MPRPFHKRIKYHLLYYFAKWLLFSAPFIPRKLNMAVYRVLGWLAFYVVRAEAVRTMNNIRYVYGDRMSDTEIRKMAKRVFVNIGINASDIIRTQTLTSAEGIEKYLEVNGLHYLEEAYNSGEGVLGIACHQGAYEMLATYLGLKGFKISVIATPLKDKRLDDLLVKNRTSRGLQNIPRGQSTIKMIKALKRGEIVFILIDQDTRVDSVYADFLGKRASTPLGASLIALKTGARVLAFATRRLPSGKHLLNISPEIPLVKTGNEENDIQVNTQKFNDVLCEFIEQDTTQWVWMHERWKTQPDPP